MSGADATSGSVPVPGAALRERTDRGPRDTRLDQAALDAALRRIWGRWPGFYGWLTTVDHKEIGRRYIVTAFVFLFLGGLNAMAMRAQLAQPESTLLGPDLYNQIFTMHGTTMMFLFAVPVMEAFAVFLVPLLVGTRNIAFPRLNAFSYWVYLFGGVMIWVAFMLNTGPDRGWFSYVTLSGPEFSPGKRVDFWAQMITFTEVAALAVSVEITVTILKQRAPGMTLDRIPILLWSQLVTALVTIFAMPAVMLSSTMLILDRLVGTHFFNPAQGGDALLWQHLFWFFGHPEVYIIFIPATGFVSAIIPTFARRPMIGHVPMVLAQIAIGLLSFGLWVHHMFATGVPQLGEGFYTANSMLVTIPSGIQIFCFIATLMLGRPRFSTPLLFCIGFILVFVIGGLTGVIVASVPLDLQVHDSYFVVAHFHYVLIGGAVFPLLGAAYYWFPKFTGRMLNERIGRWQFWLALVSFNLAFFPMHLLGLWGMPRRVYTYPEGMGWSDTNLVVSIGAYLFVVSFLLFLWNVVRSLRHGAVAGDNPWGGSSLEWATASPPPPYNFARIPVVTHREPLWAEPEALPVATGLRTDQRELVVTTVAEARPETRETSPQPSVWPLLSAIAVTIFFIGSIFTPSAAIWGTPPIAVALIIWFWPKAGRRTRTDAGRAPRGRPRPAAQLRFRQRQPDVVGHARLRRDRGHGLLAGRRRVSLPGLYQWRLSAGRGGARSRPGQRDGGAPAPQHPAESLAGSTSEAGRSAAGSARHGGDEPARPRRHCGARLRIPRAQHPLGHQCLWLDAVAAARPAYHPHHHRCGGYGGACRADVHPTRPGQALQRCRRQLLLLELRGAGLAADLHPHLLGAEVLMAEQRIPAGVPWAGLVTGPVAWAIATPLNYALAPWVCAHGPAVLMVPAVGLILLLIALGGGVLSWQAWRAMPAAAGEKGGRPYHFLAALGMLAAGLFALVIALQGAAGLVFDGCER